MAFLCILPQPTGRTRTRCPYSETASMARERDDEYADDDKRPPRRRDNDDDEGDRPARRRDRDDDDRESGRGGELGPLDKYIGMPVVYIILAVVGVFCCPCLSIVLGGIGLATTKTPEGKQGSTIALIGGVVGIVLNVILYVTGVTNNLGK